MDEVMDVDSDVPPYQNPEHGVYGVGNVRPGISTRTNSSPGVPVAFPTNLAPYHTPGTSLGTRTPVRARHSPTPGPSRNRHAAEPESFELEAVVSCTSDGLVVVLRKARPPIPAPHPPLVPAFNYENGLFAAPWGQSPIEPQVPPDVLYNFRPPLVPEHMPLRESVKAAGGPPADQLMRSIRDVAVFAWALVGINGNLAMYSHGLPRDRAQPDGLPIWDPEAGNTAYQGPENLSARRWGKMPARDGPSTTPNVHYNRNPSPRPLEPPPQRHTYSPLSSGLEHYTYGSSSTWTQPSSHYGIGSYDQSSHRAYPDPFSPGPAVLPPLRAHHSNTEPQSQLYQQSPPFSSSSHASAQLQAHEPEASEFRAHTPRPAPVPSSASPTQSASVNTLRYLWQ
jgi:hypothetical protein